MATTELITEKIWQQLGFSPIPSTMSLRSSPSFSSSSAPSPGRDAVPSVFLASVAAYGRSWLPSCTPTIVAPLAGISTVLYVIRMSPTLGAPGAWGSMRGTVDGAAGITMAPPWHRASLVLSVAASGAPSSTAHSDHQSAFNTAAWLSENAPRHGLSRVKSFD